jgi:hypothetical protein
MAPPQPITIIDPLPWSRSTATMLSLSELVTAGQLAVNEDGHPAVWIVPHPNEQEPNPPYGYVVSFIHFHEWGFAAQVSRFMRALCTTSRRTQFRKRRHSSACARASWGSPSTGISGFTSSAQSCTH